MLAMPAMIVMTLFTILPFILNVGYSFTDFTVYSVVPRFVGFKNFVTMFNDRDFTLVFMNTVKMFFIYTVGVNLMSITIGIMVAKLSKGYGNLIRSVLFFPYLLSLVVVGFLWKIMFDYTHGPINQLLLTLGIPSESLPEWLGDFSLVIPSVGIVVLWFVTGYYEAAAIDGANQWQQITNITLPFIAPSITINTVLLSITSLAVFALPMTLLDGGGPGRYGTTISLWAFTTYFKESQYGKAIAISTLLGIIAVCIAIVELRILLKREARNR
jgi:raffinose/stachyose/melibiose transport system permease protein